MQANGNIRIAATPESIAAALRDPAVLAAILPACRGVSPQEGGAFTADFAREVGRMRLGLSARLRVAGEGAAQVLEIEGGNLLTGKIAARCDIRLAPRGAETRLDWDGSVTLQGLLRKLAETAAPGTADRVVSALFYRLKQQLESRPA